MKKTLALLIIIILSIPLVMAFNDPGHDSLYVLKLGDSIITGSLNITEDLKANQITAQQRIFSPNLVVRGDGGTATSTNKIIGSSGGLFISSPDLHLNYGEGGTIKIGSSSTGSILDIQGQILLNNEDVCLADGTNCPSFGEGDFEGILSISSGGTGADNAGDARSNLGAAGIGSCSGDQVVTQTTTGGVTCTDVGSMSSWVLSVTGQGTQTINDGDTVTFEEGTGVTLSRTDSTITIAADGSGGTVTEISTGTGLEVVGGGTITDSGKIRFDTLWGDSQYYTQSSADSEFVSVSGDTMTGKLQFGTGSDLGIVRDGDELIIGDISGFI